MDDEHCTDEASDIFTAAQQGDTEAVRLLLEQGTHVDTIQEDTSATAILLATQEGHHEVVQLLLQKGASVGLGDSLYDAAYLGHIEIARLLVEHGADVDFVNDMYYTPLCACAEQGHVEIVRFLLENGAGVDIPANSFKPAAHTPLELASCGGHTEVVRLLIEKGADVNLMISVSDAPLVAACFDYHLEVVKLLLEHGAKVDIKSRNEYTPLWSAAYCGAVGVVKLLLDKGASTELTGCDGKTPLITAVESDISNVDVVKLLLERGAATTTSEGYKALLIAAHRPNYDILKVLAQQDGVTNDVEGSKDALASSVARGWLDIAEVLLKARPLLAVEEPSTLILASLSEDVRSYELLNKLIKCGANLDHSAGGTALHYAILTKQADKVWQLVLNGADTTILFKEALPQTVWELSAGDNNINEALKHFWTPQSHKYHPQWVRDAIVCVLLIAKRLWPLDQLTTFKILSFVAYGWYKAPLKI